MWTVAYQRLEFLPATWEWLSARDERKSHQSVPATIRVSTIARALQASISSPFWHYSIDHFRDSKILPMARIKAGDLVKKTAPIVGGGGGGRPDMAQAGGKDVSKLPEAISKVPEIVKELL